MFVAGLMVGRTPEYLGKKIEAKEVKMAILAILCLPLAMLGFTAVAVVMPTGLASIGNPGPHGFSEVLYAYTSGAANNGSAFGSLSGNTLWYNLTIGARHADGALLRHHPGHGHRRFDGGEENASRPRRAPSQPMADCSSGFSSA